MLLLLLQKLLLGLLLLLQKMMLWFSPRFLLLPSLRLVEDPDLRSQRAPTTMFCAWCTLTGQGRSWRSVAIDPCTHCKTGRRYIHSRRLHVECRVPRRGRVLVGEGPCLDRVHNQGRNLG